MVPALISLLHAAMEKNSLQIGEALQTIMDVIRNNKEASNIQNKQIPEDIAIFEPTGSLYDVIKQVLDICPELAKTPDKKAGCLPLHVASSLGDIRIVESILDAYPKAVSSPNKKGKLPIHYATRQGRTDICRILLNADPKTASTGTTKLKLPLHYAVSEGYDDITKLLLDFYPRGIHAVTSKGKIALHFASRWGHVRLIDQLLKISPNLAQCLDWERQLPIHEAAREGQLDAAKKLIEIYPDGLKQKNIFNELPIFAAVRFGSKELVAEMIRWYPEAGKAVVTEAISNDLVHDWDWDILELCLRGATRSLKHQLYSNSSTLGASICPAIKMHGKLSITHRCQCFKYKKKTADKPSLKSQDPLQTRATKKSKAISVIMDPDNECPDFNVERHRLGYMSLQAKANQKQKNNDERDFLALHATLECYSSIPIINRVLECYSEQMIRKDQYGMLPLHIAAYQANDSRGITAFNKIFDRNPAAALVSDSMGRLPLHLALQNKASFSVIKCLLEVNRPSAFVKCGTKDNFRTSIPLFIATSQDCCLDIVYTLFRGNPASIMMFP